jgi:hypothetical protein
MNREHVAKELAAFCARMNEHTESIRVFVTLPENGMTASHSMGGGNYYAQVGQIQEWLDNRKGENQAIEIARVMPQPPPDDGEAWKE